MRPTIVVHCNESLGDIVFRSPTKFGPMDVTYVVAIRVQEDESGKFVAMTGNLKGETVKTTSPMEAPSAALAGVFLSLAYEEYPFLELVYKTAKGTMPTNAAWEEERQALCKTLGVDGDTPLSSLFRKAREAIEAAKPQGVW